MRAVNGSNRLGPLNVLHAITGLGVGGAQMMLVRLLGAIDRTRFRSSVLSLLPPGTLAPRIAALSVPVASLDMQHGLPAPRHLGRLARLARGLAPGLIQGWMYHGNLAGTFARWWCRDHALLVWSVHHSISGLAEEKPLARRLIALSARLSQLPDAIVYCSPTSARQHEALGFAAERTVIIPNGIDTELFRPEREAATRLRQLTGADRPLVGMVARWHAMKNHAGLIRAAATLWRQGLELQLVLIGEGLDAGNAELAAIIQAEGMQGSVSLLGVRHDVPALVPGLDLLVSPSTHGEAFPLAVGEAMAAGVPCVVTDVGDCAWLVGDTGDVVRPRDCAALAAAIGRCLAEPVDTQRARGLRARRRILENFALPAIAHRYEALYARLGEMAAA
jgi:glycosyltransferase involved in cell wall biosynthesis